MSFKYSHLLGSEFKEAMTALTNAGYEIKTTELYPPKKENGDGTRRVINIKLYNTKNAEIFWSYENYN